MPRIKNPIRLKRRLLRFGRSLLCVILAGAFVMDPGLVRRYQAQAQVKSELAEELRKLEARLNEVYDALEQASQEIARDTFDPMVIIEGQPTANIEGVGTEPERLYAWVRDNTYFVPYAGVLRGHKGVLMDRMGNSFDRSLLLGELLRLSGHRVRLVMGTLSPRKAAGLLDQVRSIPKAPRPSSQDEEVATERMVQRYATQFGVNAAELQQTIAGETLKAQRLAETAVQRTAEQSQILLGVLGKEIDVPTREKLMPQIHAEAVKAMSIHAWIQWKNGDDWVDLDVTLPTARSGETLTVAATQIAPPNANTLLEDAIPVSLQHRMAIRVKIERWNEGKLEEKPVMDVEFAPYRTIGMRVAIHHAPLPTPDISKLLKTDDPAEALKSSLLEKKDWMPVLTIGDYRIQRYSFTDTGQVNDPATSVPGIVSAMQAVEAVKKGVDVLGADISQIMASGKINGGSGRSRRPEQPKVLDRPKAEAQLTAEWIEYELRTPGERPRRIRRQLFDLIGEATRAEWKQKKDMPAPELSQLDQANRALSLIGETEIAPLVCQLSPDFVQHVTAQNEIANRELHLEMALQEPSTERGLEIASDMNRVPTWLFTLALSRSAWSQAQGDSYLNRCNVFSLHRFVQQDTQQLLSIYQAFDIVANDMAVRHDSESNPFAVRLTQGILDTNVEALLISNSGDVQNTSELFNQAEDAAQDWIAVAPGKSPLGQDVEIPEDILVRMQHDIDAGNVVVRPIKFEGAKIGWWRVDMSTGQTLGMSSQGWGGAVATEYAKVIAVIVIAIVAAAAGYILCRVSKNWENNKASWEKLSRSDQKACLCAAGAAGAAGGAAAGAGFVAAAAGSIWTALGASVITNIARSALLKVLAGILAGLYAALCT